MNQGARAELRAVNLYNARLLIFAGELYVQEAHGTFVGCRGIVDWVVEGVGAGGGSAGGGGVAADVGGAYGGE